MKSIEDNEPKSLFNTDISNSNLKETPVFGTVTSKN